MYADHPLHSELVGPETQADYLNLGGFDTSTDSFKEDEGFYKTEIVTGMVCPPEALIINVNSSTFIAKQDAPVVKNPELCIDSSRRFRLRNCDIGGKYEDILKWSNLPKFYELVREGNVNCDSWDDALAVIASGGKLDAIYYDRGIWVDDTGHKRTMDDGSEKTYYNWANGTTEFNGGHRVLASNLDVYDFYFTNVWASEMGFCTDIGFNFYFRGYDGTTHKCVPESTSLPNTFKQFQDNTKPGCPSFNLGVRAGPTQGTTFTGYYRGKVIYVPTTVYVHVKGYFWGKLCWPQMYTLTGTSNNEGTITTESGKKCVTGGGYGVLVDLKLETILASSTVGTKKPWNCA